MSGSYFTMNQKYNSLLALFNTFFPYPPSPYPAPTNVMTLSTAQTATGLKTFSVLPQSSVVPLANDDLTNKAYVDSQVGSIPDLQAVLDQGSTAVNDSITLNSSSIVGGLVLSPIAIELTETSGSTLTRNDQSTTNIAVKTINGTTGDYTETQMNATTGLSVEFFNGTLGAVQTSSVLDTNSLTMSNTLGGAYDSEILIENPTTFAEVRATFDDIGNGITAVGSIKSQSGQSDYSTSVSDGTGNVGTKTLVTGAGAVLDTNTVTNGTAIATSVDNVLLGGITQAISYQNGGDLNFSQTQTTSTLADTTVKYLDGATEIECKSIAQSGQASVIASAKNLSTTANSTLNDFVSTLGAVGNITYNSDDTPSPLTVSNLNYQINATNALGGYTYNDNTPGATQTMAVASEANGGGASVAVSASLLSGGSSHLLRLEAPTLGDGLIEHTVFGSNRNLAITTTGNLLMTSDNLNITTSQISSINASAGTSGTPQLLLTNTNSTGAVFTEIYKAKPTAGVNGEVLHQQSVYGKDGANNKQEYTRVTHTIRDITAGAEDGSIEMGAFVNGSFQNFIQINGNENEINALRPLDMTGNNIRTTTGSLAINVASSATAGAVLTLATKDDVAGSGTGLALTGNTLLSATSGGSAGQHLCLTIGGVVYKIALQNP